MAKVTSVECVLDANGDLSDSNKQISDFKSEHASNASQSQMNNIIRLLFALSLQPLEHIHSAVSVDVTVYEYIVHCLFWCFRNMRQRWAQTRDNHHHSAACATRLWRTHPPFLETKTTVFLTKRTEKKFVVNIVFLLILFFVYSLLPDQTYI